MNALEKIEAEREVAAVELKAASDKVRALIEDEDRYVKRNREERLEISKEKAIIGARLHAAQHKIDLLEARLPRTVHIAVSEREVEVNRIEYELREQRRDLQSRKFDIEQMQKRGARPADLKEPLAEQVSVEAAVAELESDLEEAIKNRDAALTLKREALERLADGKTEPGEVDLQRTL